MDKELQFEAIQCSFDLSTFVSEFDSIMTMNATASAGEVPEAWTMSLDERMDMDVFASEVKEERAKDAEPVLGIERRLSSRENVFEADVSGVVGVKRVEFRKLDGGSMRSDGVPVNDASMEHGCDAAELFLGQLPTSYSEKDVRHLVIALAREIGLDAQVRDCRIHANRTCAFVVVQRSVLDGLRGLHKQCLCDLGCVWRGTTAAAVRQLEEIAERRLGGQMSAAPRSTLVLEECGKGRVRRRSRVRGGGAWAAGSMPPAHRVACGAPVTPGGVSSYRGSSTAVMDGAGWRGEWSGWSRMMHTNGELSMLPSFTPIPMPKTDRSMPHLSPSESWMLAGGGGSGMWVPCVPPTSTRLQSSAGNGFCEAHLSPWGDASHPSLYSPRSPPAATWRSSMRELELSLNSQPNERD